MQVDQISERRTLKKRKEKVPKHLKRRVKEKEMDSFTKRVLRIPLDKPFEEAYFTHGLWMFFRETKETEQNIHRIFDQIREKMKQRITLKEKSDPGKFAVPFLVKGIEFPCAICDTGSSISILPKVMADHLGLKIKCSHDSFTFVDHFTRNSGGIIRDLEVHIGNALVPVDSHVLENKRNKNHSLLLGRAFMATVGPVCNMQTNQLSCHCKYEYEYETEYSGSIVSRTPPSIDIDIHLPIDNASRESIDINPENKTFTLPSHCYPRFDVATQPQTAIDYHYSDTISRQRNYSIGSCAEESFHESFAVNTELPETRSDEYDEDYHKEKNIEYHGLAMGDRGLLHTSSADVTSTSIDSKPTPSIDVCGNRNSHLSKEKSHSEFAYEHLQQGITLGSRAVGEIPSSSNPKTAKLYCEKFLSPCLSPRAPYILPPRSVYAFPLLSLSRHSQKWRYSISPDLHNYLQNFIFIRGNLTFIFPCKPNVNRPMVYGLLVKKS
ncbi:hypothetical protein IGI04_023324 [Brassica rapa subsp. trilocularis]|uniref:Aspartic peptidase DDI1-type domain-containing protein n=1 Tax=Brassica rapa subsp. trilocularis TaxID=1813537 RepID=A0ABQ7M3I0_BRACM|nr:hypothetical protein IGI04_023324 [Brassica rapa subsp. trilocularis]